MSADVDAINQEFDRLCERLVWTERTLALLGAVDDHAWNERPARVLKALIKLSFGQGRIMVYIKTCRELAERLGMAEHHVANAIEELIDANALQVYRELKLYEVLPHIEEWRTAARCRRGFKGALELEAEIVAADRRRGEQVELGEIEQTFTPDTTLKQAAGQNAREKAGFPREQTFSSWTQTTAPLPVAPGEPLAPSLRADARESHAANHPSANTGAVRKTGGAGRLRDALLRSPAYTGQGHEVIHNPPQKLTPEVSFGPEAESPDTPKLTPKVSFGEESGAPPAKKLTPGVSFGGGESQKLTPEVSFGPPKSPASRAREKKATSGTTTSGNPSSSLSQRLPSDVVVGAEADGRGGAEGSRMLVAATDALFQDIYRFLGREGMLSFSTFWRAAIFACRIAAYEALAETKVAPRKRPGGFMRFRFYLVCGQRGGVVFRHPELVDGIPNKLAYFWPGHGHGGGPGHAR